MIQMRISPCPHKITHIQTKLQLTRKPLPLCQLALNTDIDSLFDFGFDDIKIMDYQSHERIKADVAI